MKRCSKCGVEKLRAEFASRPDGRAQAWCKQCAREYVAKKRAANPEMAEREHARSRAERRALKRLAERYPNVFARLFNEELRRAGLVEAAEWREGRMHR